MRVKVMSRRANKLMQYLLLGVIFNTNHAIADLPFVPFPSNIKVVVVGEDIKVNGLPVMAYEFTTQQSLEKVAEFYRAEWEQAKDNADSEGIPFLEQKLGNWLVLSRLEKKHNITVQLEKNRIGQTHALVGISPLPKYLEDNRKNVYEIHIPKLLGMDIVSVVASKDKGHVSEVYWIDSKRTVESTLEEFKRYYDSKQAITHGYRIESDSTKAVGQGFLRVTTEDASVRFDAVKMDDKTRVIALWQPH